MAKIWIHKGGTEGTVVAAGDQKISKNSFKIKF